MPNLAPSARPSDPLRAFEVAALPAQATADTSLVTGSPAAAVPPPADRDALRRWVQEQESWIQHDEDREFVVADMRARGWTTDVVEALTALADWAWTHNTGLAQYMTPDMRNIKGWLGTVFDRLTEHGLTAPQVWPWLALMASTPNPETHQALWALIVPYSPPGDPPENEERFRRWSSLGPLPWAAGLTEDEACTRAATGTLSADELRTLAALRGYQFPGVECVALLPS